MYVTREEVDVEAAAEPAFTALREALQESMLSADGLRWVMLLRSKETPGRFATLSMWLTPEHSQASEHGKDAVDSPAQGSAINFRAGYDVATARGSMTPGVAVALVDWNVAPAESAAFTNQWNADFHAIEDRVGSRLLRNLESSSSFTGLHVVTDEANLDRAVFQREVRPGEAAPLTPVAVSLWEIALLSEP